MDNKEVVEANKEDSEEEFPKGPVENAWALKIPSFNKGDMKHPLQEATRFEIAFPKYREKYIKDCWPLLEKVFDENGIKAEFDLLSGVMSVSTTRKTWDPYIILKARDVIKLLGRSVPVEHAIKVLKDDVTCEIIKIKNVVRNREKFIKRRQRLIGPNGTALKGLELLTDCYILVQGCTVCAVGPYKGVHEVVEVVMATMKNVHPVNLMKVLMIKKTLAKDPNKKNEDWTKYLPSFFKKNVRRKKPKKIRVKKPYTPFPPERTERKQDANMESGKFFLEKEEQQEKSSKKWDAEKKNKIVRGNMSKRCESFIPPREPSFTSFSAGGSSSKSDVDVKKLKQKIKSKSKA